MHEFKSLQEAKNHIKQKVPNKAKLSRDEASLCLEVSTDTLHRNRMSGKISAIETTINGHKNIMYSVTEVARLLFKRGLK